MADYPQQLAERFVIHLWAEFTAPGDLRKGVLNNGLVSAFAFPNQPRLVQIKFWTKKL